MGVWIDTDMGFDDIAAVLVVLHAAEEIDGVSLVFGNTPIEQVKRNAASAALAFGWNFPSMRAAPRQCLAGLRLPNVFSARPACRPPG